MPSKKEVQLFRKKIIKDTLNKFKNKNKNYTYITDLAKDVAEQVTLLETDKFLKDSSFFNSHPKAMAHQTLLANKEYKSMLIKYFEKEESLDDSRMFAKDLQISNLKNQVERLEKLISNLLSNNNNNQHNDKEVVGNSDSMNNAYLVIKSIINEFSDFMKIDTETGHLMNTVNYPPSIIVEKERLSDYLMYLEKNSLKKA